MTKLTLLQTAIKLLEEVGAENKGLATTAELSRLTNVSLTAEYRELLKDYDQIHRDCEKAESAVTDSTGITKRLQSVSDAVESLTDDLCLANDIISKLQNDGISTAALQRQIAEKNIEIKSLAAYKRKAEVLAADLKTMEAKYQKARSVQPVAAPKSKAITSKQLKIASQNLVNENAFYKKKYKNLADDYNSLVIHMQTAPTFAGDVILEGVGNIHMIDLQWHDREIKQSDGSFLKTKAQHVLCINDYGSVKTLFRVKGSDTIHVSQTPVGKHLRATNALTDIVRKRFEEWDRNYKGRKTS